MILGIETSCDETAISVINPTSDTLIDSIIHEEVHSQIEIHKDYGGVVPEIASRQHIVSLPQLVNRIPSHLHKNITDIAVTHGPGLQGCLLVGATFAQGYALKKSIPVHPTHHLEAHLLSAFSHLNLSEIPNAFPSLALLVSGGHSLICLINDIGDYRVLTQTIDDAAGEAFDKISSLLGIAYPGGAKLSALATTAETPSLFHNKLSIPVADKPEQFSFSGLKTAAVRLYREIQADIEESQQANFAAAVEHTIISSLVQKLSHWISHLDTDIASISLSGGVAANKVLREHVSNIAQSNNLSFHTPELRHCGDNASMIAWTSLLRRSCMKNVSSTNFQILPRWSISDISLSHQQ